MALLNTMTITDKELAAERLKILTSLLAKSKKDKLDVLSQLVLVQTANQELSSYANTFKLDEKAEEKNIESAKKEAVLLDADNSKFDELVVAEDFASDSDTGAIVEL